jgi:hypothetical protein
MKGKMIKIKVVTFDAGKTPENVRQMQSGAVFALTPDAPGAKSKSKPTVIICASSAMCANGAKQTIPNVNEKLKDLRQVAPPKPGVLYKEVSKPLEEKRENFDFTENSVSGSLYRRSGVGGAIKNKHLQEAIKFIRKKTAEFPASFKRRCRRQAIHLFLTYWKAGEDAFFSRLWEACKDWQKTPWNSLPADLPRKAGESSDDWLDRCYKAAGFATLKDITIGEKKNASRSR